MIYVSIKKSEKRTYAKQIYHDLREKILKGRLMEGSALPSTRELSADLAVSRNTVLTAYDMLISEGYVKSIPGSGIYVNEGLQPVHQPAAVSDYRTSALSGEPISGNTISFDSGIPALDLFPRNKWNSHVSRAFREAPLSALGYDDPQGRPELRNTLAAYLKKSRGIDCRPDHIIITTGAKQGFTLIAKSLLHRESVVLLEDPSNSNVKKIFSSHTERLIPVPVDREGIITSRLPENAKPDLLFATPSHQFPMGGILTIRRRLELIAYAQKSDCLLIEDDYDSEFRYDGAPVGSLWEFDPERVIYVGTFSKIMFPSLRLGYLVIPRRLAGQFREWKRLSDHHSNSISQLALTSFIECGDLERHIRHMKKVYRKRRDLLLGLLNQYFPNQYRIYGESSGMHLVLELSGVVFSPALVQKILDAGVYIVPVADHALEKGSYANQIILGYANLSPGEMESGLKAIRAAIDEL